MGMRGPFGVREGSGCGRRRGDVRLGGTRRRGSGRRFGAGRGRGLAPASETPLSPPPLEKPPTLPRIGVSGCTGVALPGTSRVGGCETSGTLGAGTPGTGTTGAGGVSPTGGGVAPPQLLPDHTPPAASHARFLCLSSRNPSSNRRCDFTVSGPLMPGMKGTPGSVGPHGVGNGRSGTDQPFSASASLAAVPSVASPRRNLSRVSTRSFLSSSSVERYPSL